jgi:hypothetical protein
MDSVEASRAQEWRLRERDGGLILNPLAGLTRMSDCHVTERRITHGQKSRREGKDHHPYNIPYRCQHHLSVI